MDMDKVKVIELKQNIFRANEVTADKIRERLKKKGTLLVNVMASPGAGKTTLLSRTIHALEDTFRFGVMECDIDASVDARALLDQGIPAVQLHTGGMCHMDAEMTQQGLMELGEDGLDVIFIENVGNLVCPAEYDTGAHECVAILSVPEGDDKPVKYPLMFQVCGTVLINKIDALPVFDFSREKVLSGIRERNPEAEVFFVSSRTGEGYDDWIRHLKEMISKIKEG